MNLHKSVGLLLSAAFFPVLLLGCTCTGGGGGLADHSLGGGHGLKRDFCANIPNGALPDPTGAHIRRFQGVQRENALAMEFNVYLHEWFMGGKELGPYGEYHIQ